MYGVECSPCRCTATVNHHYPSPKHPTRLLAVDPKNVAPTAGAKNPKLAGVWLLHQVDPPLPLVPRLPELAAVEVRLGGMRGLRWLAGALARWVASFSLTSHASALSFSSVAKSLSCFSIFSISFNRWVLSLSLSLAMERLRETERLRVCCPLTKKSSG